MKKLALLIGINYFNTSYQLNGCINDVNNLKDLLINNLSFNSDEIIIMNDNSLNNNYPTYDNIIKQLKFIIQKANNENYDEIWFSYSGHGYYINDTNNDEKDGYDECLVPLNGYITDDTFYDIISDLNTKTKCICLFDCCHSGSFGDLRNEYIINLNKKKINKNKINIRRKYQRKKKKKCKANIIAISGCRDNQTSADYFNNNIWKWQGALTTKFIECIKLNINITCYDLLYEINKQMILEDFKQKPVISCSKSIKYNDKFLFK